MKTRKLFLPVLLLLSINFIYAQSQKQKQPQENKVTKSVQPYTLDIAAESTGYNVKIVAKATGNPTFPDGSVFRGIISRDAFVLGKAGGYPLELKKSPENAKRVLVTLSKGVLTIDELLSFVGPHELELNFDTGAQTDQSVKEKMGTAFRNCGFTCKFYVGAPEGIIEAISVEAKPFEAYQKKCKDMWQELMEKLKNQDKWVSAAEVMLQTKMNIIKKAVSDRANARGCYFTASYTALADAMGNLICQMGLFPTKDAMPTGASNDPELPKPFMGPKPPDIHPNLGAILSDINSAGSLVFVREYILWVVAALKEDYQRLSQADKQDAVSLAKVCNDVSASASSIGGQMGGIKDSSNSSRYNQLVNSHIATKEKLSLLQVPSKLADLASAYQSNSEKDIKKLEPIVSEAINFYDKLFSAAIYSQRR